MTNEEALNILKPTLKIYKMMSKDDLSGKQFVDAFEMAISALSAQEKICPFNSDNEVTEYCVEGPCEHLKECPYAEVLPTIPQTEERQEVNKSVKELTDIAFENLLNKCRETDKKILEIPQTDIPQEMLESAIKCSKDVLDKMSEMSSEELLEIARCCGDSVLEDIKAEIENESIGYPPSADYYKAIKKAVRIIDKHISGKE